MDQQDEPKEQKEMTKCVSAEEISTTSVAGVGCVAFCSRNGT